MSQIVSVSVKKGDGANTEVQMQDGEWGAAGGIKYMIIAAPISVHETVMSVVYYVGDQTKPGYALVLKNNVTANYCQPSGWYQTHVQSGASNMYFDLRCYCTGDGGTMWAPQDSQIIYGPAIDEDGEAVLDVDFESTNEFIKVINALVCVDTCEPKEASFTVLDPYGNEVWRTHLDTFGHFIDKVVQYQAMFGHVDPPVALEVAMASMLYREQAGSVDFPRVTRGTTYTCRLEIKSNDYSGHNYADMNTYQLLPDSAYQRIGIPQCQVVLQTDSERYFKLGDTMDSGDPVRFDTPTLLRSHGGVWTWPLTVYGDAEKDVIYLKVGINGQWGLVNLLQID